MTRAEQLREAAKIHRREAARLHRRAERLARQGCVFMAGDCDEQAVRERAVAAELELDALALEAV